MGEDRRWGMACIGSGSRHGGMPCACRLGDLLRRLVEVEVGLHHHIVCVAVEVEAEVSADALHRVVLEEDIGGYTLQALGAAYG